MKRFENIGIILRDTPNNDGAGAGAGAGTSSNSTLSGGDPFADVPDIISDDKKTVSTGSDDINKNKDVVDPNKKGDKPGDVSTEYKVPSVWNNLADALSTEESKYDIPEPILKGEIDGKPLEEKEAFNMLVKEIQSHTRIPELEDPFSRDYITSKRKYGEEFDINKFIEPYARQIENKKLSDAEFHFRQMKQENGKSEDNPDGWTDEEIMADIESRSRISLTRERKEIEQREQAEAQKRAEAREIEIRENRKNEIIKRQKEDDDRLLKIENHFIKTLNVDGISVGESEMKDAIEEFKALNTYDENGKKPIYDYFSDDMTLFKSYFLTRGDGSRLRDVLADIKTKAAENILNRTSLHPSNPQSQSGGVGTQIPTADDIV